MKQIRITAAAAAAALIVTAAGATAASQAPGPGRELGEYFFGPRLARAEVVMVENGAVHDYRIDRGVIRAFARGVIELREVDGTVERIPVAGNAQIEVRGRGPGGPVGRGMIATTVRDGNGPAFRVIVTRR